MSKTTSRSTWHWATWFKLLLAGWRPNRNVWHQVSLPKSFSVFPSAKEAIAEFGNLKFQESSELVHLDPSEGERVAEEISRYERKVGCSLYPIGILDGGDTIYLLIDETGIVYTLSDGLRPFALTFHRAIEYLVSHRAGVDPALEKVGLHQKVWTLT